MKLSDYTNHFDIIFPGNENLLPWEITKGLVEMIQEKIKTLSEDAYRITNDIAIHKTAVIETGVILKGPIIISKDCFVGAHAYLRGGVYLSEAVKIGPGCEIKTSIILPDSATAHFNFIGDSIIGSHVNFEAGAVIANHYNERENKAITVRIGTENCSTGVEKFGALVGDYSKVGANAVLSPGTILRPQSVVGRLALIDQVSDRLRSLS
ncbi:LpxA family transferase [Flavobacterium cerinum]|uniref:LpxA family transferase n=1 Tax=Flavobacterium cerinum TaxID=2502784 RepID=A0ABY5IUM5_9FLAO|nr:LpxA family transferase [Flavobacterium cerinum]UUC45242.1 LpxA family transferase [Flavobacterium cerinum]